VNGKINLQEALEATNKYPSEYGILYKGHTACAILSLFLFEMAMKIRYTATDAQKKKYLELQQAYVDIAADLSHVYRLDFLLGKYQQKCRDFYFENEALKKEVEKLTAVINETAPY